MGDLLRENATGQTVKKILIKANINPTQKRFRDLSLYSKSSGLVFRSLLWIRVTGEFSEAMYIFKERTV